MLSIACRRWLAPFQTGMMTEITGFPVLVTCNGADKRMIGK
jgi:hypothetical protein